MLLEKIKLRLGINDNNKDLLLADLLEDVIEDIKEHIKSDDISNVANSIIVDLVIIKYNRLGTEGLASESYSGVSNSFIDGIPNDIRKKLNRIRSFPK